jgi:hypothetical protein
MMEQKQVHAAHYKFTRYMSKGRWSSVWHQLDEVIRLRPEKVLEIGPGPGVFKHMARLFGIRVESLDLDPDLKPDHVGSVMALPFADASYDVVCAFQTLEHLPYGAALDAFAEIVRVSRRHVIISLPDAKPVLQFRFNVPKFGTSNLLFPLPFLRSKKHSFDGEHYWEINKHSYDLAFVTNDLGKLCTLVKTYRVFENPYHRFFVFERS